MIRIDKEKKLIPEMNRKKKKKKKECKPKNEYDTDT